MSLRLPVFAIVLSLLLPGAVAAQDDQTLADIRQELNVLFVEVQRLKREMSTTGAPTTTTGAGSVLDRVNAMESELQRLTSKTEEMENRINRIVDDGTRRIADLEFRLVELEGGDIGALGETTTLGGGGQTGAPPPAPAPSTGGTQMAIGEQADFERAQEALASGDFRGAAAQFETFNQTYPGGPLAAEAYLRRGEALSSLGDTREAARAYLASFSAAPEGALAPQALYQLGSALGALGQTGEACVTLGEVAVRFPAAPSATEAADRMRSLGCS
ncbi:tol-pal system protein YbgF [Sulfitobacter sabulilitoris]|uniref:Cell division coordinator CpoB n=1 Tax=Sulfitobacter sabulilitoris TaxID=2562655 RepID=A0A5S3PLJ7_9RHOB|nr:tol-pal system protein YbgF [Sulfitobacter sabulilitoris]TMM55247.1 tol-pal system protein YbgF [Sulfitobacter sabulilitoris]